MNTYLCPRTLLISHPLNLSSFILTRSLREPGGPCTKCMEVSESRMEPVKCPSKIICKMAQITPVVG